MEKQAFINKFKFTLAQIATRARANYIYGGFTTRQCCSEFVGASIAELMRYGYPITSDAFVKEEQNIYRKVKDYRTEKSFNQGMLAISNAILKLADKFYPA